MSFIFRCTIVVLAFFIISCSTTIEQSEIEQSEQKTTKTEIIKNDDTKAVIIPVQKTISEKKFDDVWIHHGNKKLDIPRLKYEIFQISKTLPNIKYSKNLSKLIVETIAVETNLGQTNYLKNDHITRNYGLGQFVLSTTKHILDVKKKTDIKTYNAIMKFYDNKMNLRDNVRKNVKFTIALQLEYYYMCDRNISNKIATVRDRAKVWKKHYNTYHGSGTIEHYIAKANLHKTNQI